MRITFLTPVGVVGGAERVLLATIRGVQEHYPGACLGAILFADGPLRAEIERLGVKVLVVPLPTQLAGLGDIRPAEKGRFASLARFAVTALGDSRASVDFLWRLRAALRREAPDLIHSNGLKAHAFSALARPRDVPVLWHLHDFLSQRPIMVRLLRRLSPSAAFGIAVSDSVRRDAEAVLPRLPITVVRNSVDLDHFTPAAHLDRPWLDELAGLGSADPETIRIGLIATYAHWKGHDVFLDALARLVAAGVPVRGYIVGGPIYTTAGSQFSEPQLRQIAASLGLADRVGFIPYQHDPAPIYRRLDVVVHASTRPEPFGLTIAEAMSSGRAVVVAAAGGAIELFTPDHDGLGHVPGDVAGLAAAIARLAGEPESRARLGANARKTAVEQFSQDRYGREIASIYSRCLHDATRRIQEQTP